MKLTKIILYGKLVKLVGQKEFYAKLNSVGQVFSFLQANYPQIQNTLLKTNYCIKVGDRYVDEEHIHHPVSGYTLRLVPVAEGAFFGAVLGFLFTQAAPLAIKLYAANQIQKAASDLLGNQKKEQTKAQKDKSISGSFNGISNTVNAGTAIPLLYGETVCGSIVVSNSVDSVQFSGKGKEDYN